VNSNVVGLLVGVFVTVVGVFVGVFVGESVVGVFVGVLVAMDGDVDGTLVTANRCPGADMDPSVVITNTNKTENDTSNAFPGENFVVIVAVLSAIFAFYPSSHPSQIMYVQET